MSFDTYLPIRAENFLSLHNKLAKLNDDWMTDIRKVHQAYIESGCSCQHNATLNKKKKLLKDLKIVYAHMHKQYSQTKNETAVAYGAMIARKDIYKQSLEILTHAKRTRKSRIESAKNLKSLKFHGVASVGALIALFEASSDIHAEDKRLKADIAQKKIETSTVREEYVQAANDYINKRDYTQWAKMLLRKSSVFYNGVVGFAKLEEDWGLAKWRNKKDESMFSVAKDGLDVLICKRCNGWRWANHKVSFAEGS